MIALVYAAALNGVIGDKGGLPWHVPSDLKHFRTITMGKPIIMGRKTWDSLPKKPLPGRRNIVLTRARGWRGEGADVAHDVAGALRLAGDAHEICVIGGADVFRLFWPRAGRIYLTRILSRPDGDTVMPDISAQEWREAAHHAAEQGALDSAPYETFVYERR